MTYCTNDCTTCNHPSRREYAHDIICCPHKKPLFDLEDLLEEVRDMICKEHFPTNPEIQESTPIIIHGYSEFFHAD